MKYGHSFSNLEGICLHKLGIIRSWIVSLFISRANAGMKAKLIAKGLWQGMSCFALWIFGPCFCPFARFQLSCPPGRDIWPSDHGNGLLTDDRSAYSEGSEGCQIASTPVRFSWVYHEGGRRKSPFIFA